MSTLQGCRFIRNPKWCPKNEILERACVRFYRYVKKDLTGTEKRTMLLQHSTAQHSTAQHSTAHHSTAQHSTAQHSTAHNCAYFSFICILNRQVKGVSLNSHARRFFCLENGCKASGKGGIIEQTFTLW